MSGRARVTDIIALASKLSGVEARILTGSPKSAAISRVRQAACLIAREHGHSLPFIGRMLGGRDHTTIMHACRVAVGHCERDARYAEFVDELRKAADETAPFVLPYEGPIVLKPEAMPKPEKPKNNFRGCIADGMDEGHRFHAGVRRGSVALAKALGAA